MHTPLMLRKEIFAIKVVGLTWHRSSTSGLWRFEWRVLRMDIALSHVATVETQ
jgi:hypothetical protein